MTLGMIIGSLSTLVGVIFGFAISESRTTNSGSVSKIPDWYPADVDKK